MDAPARTGQLTPEEQSYVTWLCHVYPTLATTRTLVEEFRSILHQREGHRLDASTVACRTSHIAGLVTFAKGPQRDWKAVVAGLSYQASNGQAEGQINKLKVLKHMMYGRAKFPLLRQRMLHAA